LGLCKKYVDKEMFTQAIVQCTVELLPALVIDKMVVEKSVVDKWYKTKW
jgi:hypothetical protein